MQLLLGLGIPLLGTVLGAAMVFFMRNKMNIKVEKILLGFASGVMIAASIWSLIMPSIDMAKEQGKIAWIPASIGFLFGIVFLLASAAVLALQQLCESADNIYRYELLKKVGVDEKIINKSLFTQIFAGSGGTDLYTNAISDVYQDNFDEGIFTGKGSAVRNDWEL